MSSSTKPRALAWMSQLAYETDFDKIAAICAKMKIARIGDPIHRGVATGLPVASTYVLVLDLGPAVVVSFAGTDPANPNSRPAPSAQKKTAPRLSAIRGRRAFSTPHTQAATRLRRQDQCRTKASNANAINSHRARTYQ